MLPLVWVGLSGRGCAVGSLLMLLATLPAGLQWAMAVLAPICQLLAIVHVVRTGRGYTWIWIILFFPLLGSLIYFFSEVRPHSVSRPVGNPVEWLLDKVVPGRELARLRDRLERTASVATRTALAEYYVRLGDYAQALPLYEACLTGVYKDDPGLLIEVARIHFLAGHPKDAFVLLEQAKAVAPTHEGQKRDFWLARVAEELGDREGALAIYDRIRTTGPITEEARVRLAMLLEDRGDKPRAKELYTEVVRRMRSANNTYRREQKPWLVLARQRLKLLKDAESRA